MKKEELIKQIQEKIPDGAEVVIFDHNKNLHDDIGEGSAAGIYKTFDVHHFTEQEIKDGCIPFAALIFDNEDYDSKGNKVGEENSETIEKKTPEQIRVIAEEYYKDREWVSEYQKSN